MNLTFKRGTIDELTNTDIAPNMIYFTTDNNGIYMDNDTDRYKIFGLNDGDIANNELDSDINKYYDSSLYHSLLTNYDIATDCNTTHKEAIGTGYYNDVIGDDIEDVLYTEYPSITSSISYLQTIARSSLHPIWINNDPDNTWHIDSPSSMQFFSTITESLNISLDEKYLGYVILVQPCLDDTNCVYPILIFDLPSTLMDNKVDKTYYRQQQCRYNYIKDLPSPYDNFHITNTLEVSFDVDTPNQMTITKTGRDDIFDMHYFEIPYHKYLVPLAVYGWRV